MYKRNETITAIHWDGSLQGLNKIKEEMPCLHLVCYQTLESKKGYAFAKFGVEKEVAEPDTDLFVKPGSYIVMIKDYLGGINYCVYNEHCFNLAFTKE